MKKTKTGNKLVRSTDEAFTEVTTRADKVDKLVAQISTASRHQAEGIVQLNQTMMAMDGLTQKNAKISENSAAASEDLNSRAEQMKSYVDSLTALVGNSLKNGSQQPSA